MFCPNCGTQNESAATPCKKCGFKLSGISVPKFKGTMMLNSDQTVAEMIEEHRKKQGQGGTAEKSKARASEPAPRRSPGSSAPPSSLGGPKGPVHQPPRVAAPTRGRMGGTMLGVAPQVGGHSPTRGASAPGAPAPPEAPSSQPSRSEPAVHSEAAPVTPPAPSPRAPEGLAATLETAAREPAAPDAEPAPDAPKSAPVVDTRADGDPSADADPAPDEAAAPADPAVEVAPAPARAVAVTAPLPQVSEQPQPPETEPTAALSSSKPPPARLSPLDIVLIVCTFGVYGLVLWAKQRKQSA